MTLTHAHANPLTPARVVVLGAGGFLGSRLIATCAAVGIEATGLGARDVDLADSDAGARLAARLRAKDVLVFLAALTPDKGRDSLTLMKNIAMGRAVCEATRAIELAQLVYVSSDAVYSFATPLICEETPAAPVDFHGAMHRTRELMLVAEAKAPVTILRCAAVYGAGDTHNSYGPNRFIRQARTSGNIALFGNGEETRDHLYIDDVVALTLRMISHGSIGLINLATGRSETFRAVAEMAAKQVAADLGEPVIIEPSPRRNPITHRHFNVTNLLRAFPDARFTPLAEGLRKMIADRQAPANG